MYNIDLLILLVALLANILLGLLVISRDSSSATNKLFFGLMSAMSIWSFTNYLSYINTDTLFYARLVLCFAVLFATFFFLFVLTFPLKHLTISKRRLFLICSVSVVAMAITLSPLAFKAIKVTASSHLGNPIVGPGIGFFALTVGIYDIGGLIVLTNKTRRAKAKERIRRLYLLIGMTLMLLTIISLDFILPVAFSNTRFIPLAPMFIFPFVTFTAYAIVKHRLLDIRTAAARGITYLLSLGTIGFAYGIVVYIVASIFSHNNVESSSIRIFYIALALLTALIYTNVKKFFDKITSKVFFRDSYNTQTFLDELNKILVGTLELEQLLHSSATLISNTFKTSEVIFVLEEDANGTVRYIGTTNRKLSGDEFKTLRRLFESRHTKVALADDLVDEEFLSLHDVMVNQDIGIIARLETNKQKIGYILTGPKLSGNAYFEQDGIVLGIVSDDLAISIQNALRFEQIKNFNITLQQKIDDATRKLRHANEKLKDLDETKDDFISMASHQLRTPLTSVKGYLSMVLEQDAGKINKKQKEMLGQAFFSSQRMVYLIADLLNISRLKTGKFVIEPSKVNLAEVVEQEIGQLKETAAARSLTLTYQKPKSFPDLMLDETKTRQVIMNFIDNAIYYTPTKGHINVRVIDGQSTVELRVEDDGIGVPKSERAHLFTKFYRAGNARKARPDGTGLGLFMAKKVIVAQGGSLIFESQEGKGSTFGFLFSKSKHAA